MLVLIRKLGDRIVVPHLESAVTVLVVGRKAVRLGISAPQEIAVYREEVWQEVFQEVQRPPPKAYPRGTKKRSHIGASPHE
jgi:carbon storage regulator